MAAIELVIQTETNTKNFRFAINEYRCDKNLTEQQIINKYFETNIYSSDDFRKDVRALRMYNKKESFKNSEGVLLEYDSPNSLSNAFENQRINISDFKSLSKAELLSYFFENNNWELNEEKLTLLNFFKDKIETADAKLFYLISPEFFDKNDSKVSFQGRVYIYYYLILWLEVKTNKLYACEYYMD